MGKFYHFYKNQPIYWEGDGIYMLQQTEQETRFHARAFPSTWKRANTIKELERFAGNGGDFVYIRSIELEGAAFSI